MKEKSAIIEGKQQMTIFFFFFLEFGFENEIKTRNSSGMVGINGEYVGKRKMRETSMKLKMTEIRNWVLLENRREIRRKESL